MQSAAQNTTGDASTARATNILSPTGRPPSNGIFPLKMQRISTGSNPRPRVYQADALPTAPWWLEFTNWSNKVEIGQNFEKKRNTDYDFSFPLFGYCYN